MFGLITMRAVFGRRLGVVVASHEETLRKAKGEKATHDEVAWTEPPRVARATVSRDE